MRKADKGSQSPYMKYQSECNHISEVSTVKVPCAVKSTCRADEGTGN